MRKLLYALFYVSWTVQETLIKKKQKRKNTRSISVRSKRILNHSKRKGKVKKASLLKVIKAV